MHKMYTWIPFAIVSTLLCGLIYGTVQQSYRQSANDPQIQLSEDIAASLSQGGDPSFILGGNTTIDLSTSLAPFIIVYNDKGEPVSATAQLHGQTPKLPFGVLDYTREHKQNRLTWQPESHVREAAVVTRYVGSSPGFVLAGRSLREVEKREITLEITVFAVWILALASTFIAVLFRKPQTGSS
jgi:hypothetical protein